MADLLFTGGIIVAHTEALEPAIKYLDLSKEYGFVNSILIDQTIKDYQEIINFSFSV